MKGYPKHIATMQDFKNLLAMKEHKKQAMVDLQAIHDLDDTKMTIATTLIDEKDPEAGYNTKIIDNPLPVWKQKGFTSRAAVATMITKAGGK